MKFQNEFHSDIEEFPNKIYAKHFPNSIQLGDITKLDTKEIKKYGSEWVITGGFPCQDISIAGKGAGLSGSRSGLWFEMQRIISELRPRYAIMENVPALTFRGLDRVLGSLADIGYDAVWTVISARDIGAPHLRKRIWIVAYPSQQQSPMCDSKPCEQEQIELRRMGGEDQLSNSNKVGCNGRNCQGNSEPKRINRHEKVGGKNRSLSEMVQAHNGHLQWQRTFEPEFVRVVDGIPDQLDRIGACGNSIVSGIAKILFQVCEANLTLNKC
jgi:DNA (cytosine-5)-methyltransferase 1